MPEPELPTEYESELAWRQAAAALFGPDPFDWRFVCPVCKRVQSVLECQDAGMPQGAVARSCIGRWLEDVDCDYVGGGLFRLNPITIKGHELMVFAFAPPAAEETADEVPS